MEVMAFQQRMQRSSMGGGIRGGGGSGGATHSQHRCHKCNQRGHIRRDCPVVRGKMAKNGQQRKGPYECYRCGEVGHMARDCQVRRSDCYCSHCRRHGHTEKACQARKRVCGGSAGRESNRSNGGGGASGAMGPGGAGSQREPRPGVKASGVLGEVLGGEVNSERGGRVACSVGVVEGEVGGGGAGATPRKSNHSSRAAVLGGSGISTALASHPPQKNQSENVEKIQGEWDDGINDEQQQLQQQVQEWEAECAAGVLKGEHVWSRDLPGGARAPVKLYGTTAQPLELLGLVDTEAQVSVMSSDVARRGGWRVMPTRLRTLVGIGGEEKGQRGVQGVVRVRTQLPGVAGVVTYAVVDGMPDVLPAVVVGHSAVGENKWRVVRDQAGVMVEQMQNQQSVGAGGGDRQPAPVGGQQSERVRAAVAEIVGAEKAKDEGDAEVYESECTGEERSKQREVPGVGMEVGGVKADLPSAVNSATTTAQQTSASDQRAATAVAAEGVVTDVAAGMQPEGQQQNQQLGQEHVEGSGVAQGAGGVTPAPRQHSNPDSEAALSATSEQQEQSTEGEQQLKGGMGVDAGVSVEDWDQDGWSDGADEDVRGLEAAEGVCEVDALEAGSEDLWASAWDMEPVWPHGTSHVWSVDDGLV